MTLHFTQSIAPVSPSREVSPRKSYRRSTRRSRSLFFCAIASTCLIGGQSWNLLALTPATEIVVETGDRAPDGDGFFDLSLSGTTAVLNNCGWTAFRGSLSGTTAGRDYGEFLADGSTRTQVARTHDSAPGGPATDVFRTLWNIPSLNDAGQVLFEGETVLNNQRTQCIFRSKALTRLFDGQGQVAPDHNGTVFLGVPAHEWPAFNQKGVAAFVATLTGTKGGTTDDSAIYRASAPGKLTQIAREGQNVPEGNGVFDQMIVAGGIHFPVLNDIGQVAFRASLRNASAGNQGLYRGDGKKLIKIARAGEALPGGGTLVSFGSASEPDMNDGGEVVFPLSIDGEAGDEAIFKGSGGTLTKIARRGDRIPNSTNTFGGFEGYARINNSGQVAFDASVSGTNTTYGAIFRGNGTNTIMVVREGQATPQRSGIFSSVHHSAFCLNKSGQIAFTAGLDVDLTNNTPIEEGGIYFFDGSQLFQVARTKDTFMWPDKKSGIVTTLEFSGTSIDTGLAPSERSALNDAGQVVFGLTTTFADNTQRHGIVIWSPTLQLLCASSRKTHGTNKTFDFELPLTGALGVECRSGGNQGNLTLVLRFTNKLKTPGNVSVTTGVGSVSGTPTIKGNIMTVNLTGVRNAQKIVVSLSNVTDNYGRTLASAKVPMGVLLGDVDGNRTVNDTDVNNVNAKVDATTSSSNFRDDVDVDGNITQNDVSITQAQVGKSIP